MCRRRPARTRRFGAGIGGATGPAGHRVAGGPAGPRCPSLIDQRGESAAVEAEPGLDGGTNTFEPGRPLVTLQLGDEPAVLGVEQPGECPARSRSGGHSDDAEHSTVRDRADWLDLDDDGDPGGRGR